MLEPFYLTQNPDAIDNSWRQKHLITCEIMGRTPRRSLRPDLVGDRSRLDLMWNGKNLGVRGPTQDDGTYTFFTVEEPDTPNAGIKTMISEFMQNPPQIPLAQVRFRAGPGNSQGIWFDTSNESIHKFLEEGHWIESWLDKGRVVETGQKQKEVVKDPSRGLKLISSRGNCWLPSYDIHNNPIELQSRICHFSQPGPEANRALFAASFELLDDYNISSNTSWVEWGAGYGNLTAGFATRLGPQGFATEMDSGSYEFLEKNQSSYFNSVGVESWAAEKGLPSKLAFNPQFWLLDPPRPGFGKLLETLLGDSSKPEFVFSLHCHSSGLIADSAILKKAGYINLAWSSVDTFPATPHFEVISLWKKN